MELIKTNVGGAEVLIEAINTNGQSQFWGMEDTADVADVIGVAKDALRSAREIINGIAEEMSKSILSEAHTPAETKIGFSMSLTTEGNLWLIKSGTNMTLNVELTWKKDNS